LQPSLAEAAMKQSYLKSLALALILATPLVAGCGKTVGETIDDTTITTRVKTAMLNDPAVGGLRIDVDTFKGVVTLSGRVKSQAEKQQAVNLARRVSGVPEVKDALQVIPAGESQPAAPAAPAQPAPAQPSQPNP
jgi:hypothetical protein